MRNVYIINPKAGKHDHTVQFMERIRAVHAAHGEEPEIYLTQRAGHGEELARAAAEKGDAVHIWAVGGDGTVLEVVRGAEFHKNAAVGVYPCGSGNDFVRSFGKREVFLNPENQLAGKTVSIDMIRTQHGDAVNICSVGFDAKVAAEMNYYKHLPFVSGELAYTISLAKCFLGHLADKMTVTFYYADGTKETVTGGFLFTLAGNGRWYGGGYCGAPNSVMDDGLLDFVMIRKPAYSRIPGLVTKYKRGEHLSNPAFSDLLVYRRGVKIEIQSENEVVSNMDGLCIKVKSEEYNILPHALNFILPRGAALPKEPKNAR